jgi:hypothetical protein
MNDPVPRYPRSTRFGLHREPTSDAGRLWVLAMVGLFAGALPLPAIPTALLRRVRGAVVHEVSARYGLTLTADARQWLSEPSRAVRRGAFVATAAFVAKRALRRLGVLGVLPPVLAWLEVYALGLLFERYLSSLRQSQTMRIDVDEARTIRTAIDQSIGRVASPGLRAGRVGGRDPTEELRDIPTRVSDGILIGLASGPVYLRRRLETAFERTMHESPADFENQRGPAHV